MAGSHDSSPTRQYGAPSVSTTYVGEPDYENFCEQVNLGTGSATFNVAAPCGGRLVRVEVQSQTTTDASNGIQLAITNESNSAAAMCSVDYDDDPALTTNVVGTPALSTTAANLLVDQGDNIEIAYTETGTIAGGAVALYFAAH